jgi:hypothetical protein
MIHRRGPFDREQLAHALKGYLPFDGKNIQSYDVEYFDEELGETMLANFVWINSQWVYVDSRTR